MLFAHDTVAALRAAVELVNTAEEPDTLTTVAQVDAWYAAHGYTGRRDGGERVGLLRRVDQLDRRPQRRDRVMSEQHVDSLRPSAYCVIGHGAND